MSPKPYSRRNPIRSSVNPTQSGMSYFPTYTTRTRNALFALAHSRPTPEQYAIEKARILRGERG